MKRFIEGLALCAVVYVIIMGAGMLLSDADTPVHSADCYAHCAVCLHDNDCKTPISAPPDTQPQAPVAQGFSIDAIGVVLVSDGKAHILSCTPVN